MAYDKPFKTYDEQITKLQNDYGLMINDINFAKHALISIPYYDLVNGYKSTLMENGKFKPGLSIEYLYELYLLDKSIQAFIMKYSLFIENMFKNLLAYSIASSFGVDEAKYLDTNNYQSYNSGVSFKDNVLSEILPLLKDTAKCKMPTKHYKENHNHIPPWILFKIYHSVMQLICSVYLIAKKKSLLLIYCSKMLLGLNIIKGSILLETVLKMYVPLEI